MIPAIFYELISILCSETRVARSGSSITVTYERKGTVAFYCNDVSRLFIIEIYLFLSFFDR